MKQIAEWLSENGLTSPIEATVADFVADSRLVTDATVFAALPGERTDGRRFVEDAVENGAVMVLSPTALASSIPHVVVPDLVDRLPTLAASFFDYPTRECLVVGVTGTNGKTTTAHLIEEVLRCGGKSPGVMGTISYRYGGKTIDAPNTTPDALTLQRTVAEMRAGGTDAVVMEVSSHALAGNRVDCTEFDVGVFTNLSPEHLDFHGEMESYFEAKTRLFTKYMAGHDQTRAVINTDDNFGTRLAKIVGTPVWTVGRTRADFQMAEPVLLTDGFTVEVETPVGRHHLEGRMPGLHNVYNAVEAFAAGVAAGVKPEAAATAIAGVTVVPGRLERFATGSGPHAVNVFVDYAHTEDALTNVLRALRQICHGRLWVVFGCGGDRDKRKREPMGTAAADLADVIVLTSDNPRTEDPQKIIDTIEAGVLRGGGEPFNGKNGYRKIADRKQAIELAVSEAAPGDVVLVAGKGHETYQILGTKRVDFDDREIVTQALARRGE